MRKLLSCLLMVVLCVSLTGCKKNEKNHSGQQLAMWFSYLDYKELDPSKTLEDNLDEVIKNSKELGCNTLYVHATAFTDAYYASSFYTNAPIVTQGDPLAYFVKQGHKEGMRVIAWVNPMRSFKTSELDRFDISKTGSEVLRTWIDENKEEVGVVNDRYYLNIAYPSVRDLILSSVDEILKNYDVDGLIMDDYFYPEGVDESFDGYIYYNDVEELEEEVTLSTYRTNNVNLLVRSMHDLVDSYHKTFGISVAGNMQANVTKFYANPNYWINMDYVDYIAPQIYWGFEHESHPFEKVLKEWECITKDKLQPALAAYKIDEVDSYAGSGKDEWKNRSDVLTKQIEMIQNDKLEGMSFFRYGSLCNNEGVFNKKSVQDATTAMSNW